jgi:hypothetical protein
MSLSQTPPHEAPPWVPAVGDKVRIAYKAEGRNELPPHLQLFADFIGHTGEVAALEYKPTARTLTKDAKPTDRVTRELSDYILVNFRLPGMADDDLPRQLHMQAKRFELAPQATTVQSEEGLQKKLSKFVENMLPHGTVQQTSAA